MSWGVLGQMTWDDQGVPYIGTPWDVLGCPRGDGTLWMGCIRDTLKCPGMAWDGLDIHWCPKLVGTSLWGNGNIRGSPRPPMKHGQP